MIFGCIARFIVPQFSVISTALSILSLNRCHQLDQTLHLRIKKVFYILINYTLTACKDNDTITTTLSTPIAIVAYLFKENLAVVDTPGIGDSRQKEVAKKMMKYLPNALAFVFVINVPAAGGLQEDRVTHNKNSSLSNILNSVCSYVCQHFAFV